MRPERTTLVPTAVPHVWFEQATGKYLFSDETEDIENGEYDTLELAKAALASYVEWALRPREA